MGDDSYIQLSGFLESVRPLLRGQNNGDVQDIVDNHISQNYGRNWPVLSLTLDIPLPEDPLGESIFDALVTCPKISQLTPADNVEASWLPLLFFRALVKLPRRRLINFRPFAMSAMEAEAIFEAIQSSNATVSVFFAVRYDEEVMASLSRFVKEARLKSIGFVDWNHPRTGLSQATFTSLCSAAGDSSSLKSLSFRGSMLAGLENATKSLADLLSISTSLADFWIDEADVTGALSMGQLCRDLSCTEAVRNFDLCFRRIDLNDSFKQLRLDRTIPWKPLLSQQIRLDYWPSILAKANRWDRYDSHSSLDALYFLIKEKNPVLLQNVRRRRIRKRKRSQFYMPS
jgi:hypothetical protein